LKAGACNTSWFYGIQSFIYLNITYFIEKTLTLIATVFVDAVILKKLPYIWFPHLNLNRILRDTVTGFLCGKHYIDLGAANGL